MSKTLKRILIYSVIGIAICVGIYYYFSMRSSGSNVEYSYDIIQRDTISQQVTATGVLNDSLAINVGTQVTGIISKLFVDWNSIVKKGQLMALIDTVPLVNAVLEAQASLLKAQSNLVQLKNEYDRQAELIKTNAISQSDYDVAYANYLAGQSDVKSAEAALSITKTNLGYAHITAPINGVVISRNVDVGNTVVASFQTPNLFIIANDLHKMQVQASIDEADMAGVKLGEKVKFTVDAYPDEEFSGVVVQIRLQPVTVQNVVDYSVMIDVLNPDLKLLPGMNATLSVIVAQHPDVLKIPLAAVFFDPVKGFVTPSGNQKEGTVWIVCDSTNSKEISGSKVINGVSMVPVHVAIGINNLSSVEVSGAGLKEGMKVLTGMTKVTQQMKGIMARPTTNSSSSKK